FSEPDRAADSARALWHCDGWRMGGRGVADHGVHSTTCSWLRFRAPAVRLPDRILARLDRLRPAVSDHRMAGNVHGWGTPGALSVLYPTERTGITQLEPDHTK